jgi:glutathione synthase/RimK-type ligase-like ATP-grasp enzyme
MRILITSSRMPYALDAIRKLGERGHEVWASDSYDSAPGSHSRYLQGQLVTASPSEQTERFVDDIEAAAREHRIELVLPMFEEVFYLATQADRLAAVTTLYAASFETLARVHDKDSFQRLSERLGLPTPETVVAHSDDELRQALERFPRFFARAAFSRGGVSLLTNTGPLAGHLSVDDCHPTQASPWLVQEFVDGPMQCTYSTLHDGKVTAHCAYRAPRQWEHSTAIQFESVDTAPSLEVTERLGSELSYTGQMSLDFVQTDHGLMLIECNPRATDGVLLLSAAELEDGLLQVERESTVVEPGRETQLDLAVFGQMFSQGLGEVPRSIQDLVRIRGAGRGWRDAMPSLYSFLAFARSAKLSMRERQQLLVAMADGITWDGEPIAGLSESDAAVLEELTGEPAGG